jgi:hypothetical protein
MDTCFKWVSTKDIAWDPKKDPQKGKEAAAPSNIREIEEIQGGQEAPHNGGAISPKDA